VNEPEDGDDTTDTTDSRAISISACGEVCGEACAEACAEGDAWAWASAPKRGLYVRGLYARGLLSIPSRCLRGEASRVESRWG
jgi:hypothetical protein